jgi:Cd2+/Zn2+-exporting ATPase
MSRFWERYKTVIISREFAIAAITGLLILLSAMLRLAGVIHWIPTVLALTAVAVGGTVILIGAIRGILQRQVNVDELVAIAIIASVIYGEYLSAAFVAFMMIFGKVLEDFTSERARKALEDLEKITPTVACVRRDGQESLIPVEELVPGDLVIVRSGERIAVDGKVVSGQASVNQAPITGESMPLAKTRGSEVYAGTLNELGALEIRTTKVGESTTLGQIVRLVEEAEENRAPIVRTADHYAKYFTPLILIIAAIVYLITHQINYTLSVLIVSCPCALVLATPIAIVAGVANGARRGILIKGGARLEAAGKVTAVALDKTGTITLGRPQVIRVLPFEGVSEKEVLEVAAIAEKLSEHPLGKAIMTKAREQGLSPADAEDFRVVPGHGVMAQMGDKKIVVGNRELLQEHQIDLPQSLGGIIGNLEEEGLTVLLVASSGRILGLIGVADVVREEVRRAVQELKHAGVKKVVMLTGDNHAVAKRIASEIGVDEWHAKLLPAEKVEYVRKMQREGYKVAMVGDGINDAPALAQADVGIAMGITGTDVAMDTADIVLMTDNALRASEALTLSRKTLRVVKQNLGFALFFNLVGVAAASLGVLSPIAAALFHNFGSVAGVVNAARLAGTRSLS